MRINNECYFFDGIDAAASYTKNQLFQKYLGDSYLTRVNTSLSATKKGALSINVTFHDDSAR
jgi:hypothetical protein